MPTTRTFDHYVNLPCYVAFTRKPTHVLLTATFRDWTCNKSHVNVTIRINYKRENHEKSLQFLPYGRSIGSWICLTHKTYTSHGTEYDTISDLLE
jgi:hypothetical protein